jgi:hypothetical protein
MGDTLSLFEYGQKRSDFGLDYIILKKTSDDLSELYQFSPEVMQLSEDIFAVDLSKTQSFWQKKAEQAQLSERVQWQERLSGQTNLFVFCSHPFQGLLFFNHLESRQAQGCFFMDTLFAQKNYQNLGWHFWMLTATQIEERLNSAQILVKERKGFDTQLKRFERFLTRMRLTQIEELKGAEFFQLQRRFGPFMGLVWRWTFSHDGAEEFPWLLYKPFSLPEKKTSLEFPSSGWPQILPDLESDLLVLQSNPVLKPPYYVTGLVWNLVFYDGESENLELHLNLPLSLHFEAHRAAILQQLYYAFERVGQAWRAAEEDSDISHQGVLLGWTLAVLGRVALKEETLSLFLESNMQQSSLEGQKVLQSKLQSPIQVYQSQLAHVPGFNFKELNSIEPDLSPTVPIHYGLKPLFLYAEPIRLDPQLILRKRFLERTASAWWQTKNWEDQERSYYICELSTGEWVWSFQNFKNEWYRHGLFS